MNILSFLESKYGSDECILCAAALAAVSQLKDSDVDWGM